MVDFIKQAIPYVFLLGLALILIGALGGAIADWHERNEK